MANETAIHLRALARVAPDSRHEQSRSYGDHGEHWRQPCRDRRPCRAGVARAEHLAGGGAEVELELPALSGAAERLAQYRQVGVLGWQSIAPCGPVGTSVAGFIDAHAAVGGDAIRYRRRAGSRRRCRGRRGRPSAGSRWSAGSTISGKPKSEGSPPPPISVQLIPASSER
jgi:hypothetical protein